MGGWGGCCKRGPGFEVRCEGGGVGRGGFIFLCFVKIAVGWKKVVSE